ncbi:hypothetical protein M422DRAFT_220842 [Sphaerobolus stellatus SS14]|nr:hypothetical protein M422DRAFT_220842 [Sphaerobolus stellatus SS14]
MNATAHTSINVPALTVSATHLQASKYFLVAAFTMLVYDYLITVGQEVESIWKQTWSGATLLFALNRYGSLLQRPIIVAAFLSPAWSRDVPSCQHFVRFSGGSTVGIVAIGELILILRVWAIWHRNKKILAFLSFMWIMQVTFSGMALGYSQRVPFPPFFVGCILTGIDNRFIPFWLMPLFTDSVIFFLTVYRVLKYSRTMRDSGLFKVLFRDGILYFFCIFSVNFLNVILYIVATEDLKAIGAGFSQTLTSVMVSRLVLNLRGVRAQRDVDDSYTRVGASLTHTIITTQKISKLDQFMGPLNQESFDSTSSDQSHIIVLNEISTQRSQQWSGSGRERMISSFSSFPTSPFSGTTDGTRTPATTSFMLRASTQGGLTPLSPYSPDTPYTPYPSESLKSEWF